MINLSVEEIMGKIKSKADITEQEILDKIDKKLDDLSGLISKQGAAHIIANEYGVNLYEQLGGRIKISDVKGGLRSIETAGKVQKIFEIKEFNTGTRQGKVGTVMLGDETGTIRVVFWNDQTEKISEIKDNDIILIRNAYARENQGRKEIHINDKALININPENVTVSQVKEYTSDLARKKIAELSSTDQNIELMGTIVQVLDPRFFEVCPTCGKRVRQYQDSFACEQHEKVTPEYSYVLNVVLDDGSMPNGTIRTVFFRNQVLSLLQITQSQMIKYKDTPHDFDTIKSDLLGEIIKVVGRVKTNEMFDRMEFVGQMVTKADPEEELKRLEADQFTQSSIGTTKAATNETNSSIDKLPSTPSSEDPVSESETVQ